MTRPPRRVNGGGLLRDPGGEIGDEFDRKRIGRGQPACRKCQRRDPEIGRQQSRRPSASSFSTIEVGITAMPSPSIAMWMTVASEALA